MKKYFVSLSHRLGLVVLLALAGSASLSSCSKKDDQVTADYTATDDALIQKYIAANNITTAQKQTSGLYFVPTVTNATAAKPTSGTTVSFLFTGTLLDGTVFGTSGQDKSKAAYFVLGNPNTISGLQEGISLMHLGDKATLLIPSGLAFGSAGNGGTVPANTVIRIDVELVDLNFAATDDALIQQYITANNITGAQKQASGLYYVPVVANAAGTPAAAGKTVSVLYTGKLLDGSTFDASSQHGNTPLTFTLGAKQVIAGWDEGIALMRKGEKATLLIPSAQAYGPSGAGTAIPPNAVLRFDVELTDVK
ncbi:FKBP-type peptidyl-prolyl cis-trans isomerase [Hymenobacter sp. RP-2-7]|uniref:Peptidyl-prolyl cis-trans isomerase n=1 Tax=Hymenobacter polaris TaxID=2682546 RepID=A0A7Y0AC21_9BACT|nr:FKBP-type peptidyl-prolyl cis-trans isomerase [Hymenobacter polaris]NML64583.1 FKBP-type peptidyl-prolyl cis-trans isomerase [Hymenobacter polaris]